eukprot:2216046-Amphidinium_carterae.1
MLVSELWIDLGLDTLRSHSKLRRCKMERPRCSHSACLQVFWDHLDFSSYGLKNFGGGVGVKYLV